MGTGQSKIFFRPREILNKILNEEIRDWERFDFLYSYGRYEFLLERLSKVDLMGKKILDVGSGLLHQAVALSMLGADVFCIDAELKTTSNTSGKKLNYDFNKRRKLYHLKQHYIDVQIEKFPYFNNYFDYVIFTEVLEHFWLSPVLALREIKRVLKYDGVLLLSTPNAISIIHRGCFLLGKNVFPDITKVINDPIWSFHHKEYTMYELKKLLNILGFSVIYSHSYDPFLRVFKPDNGSSSLKTKKLLKILSLCTFFSPTLKQSLYLEARK